MYRSGHVGVGLFLYAPVGYFLLSGGRFALAVAGFVVVVWFAMVPDLDTRTRLLTHRGATHTLAFAALFGLACGAGGWALGTRLVGFGPRPLAGFGGLLGALVVLAHLLADWLTPMGVAPFWPLSSRRYSLGLATAANTTANALLLLLGAGATAITLRLVGLI
ncbi:metal-dependent hydrolase [Halococcus hamelinensis]|uniref:Membrane-bound metal-dependent hydrolase n=1 Tax=Halococcus hamelinensis 100A6 TaxID=1132509 RepID=M0M542_9EURY|nr:metal-dependent hydrolase [Halococcus hamelinensis]EMA40826.1 membrane-bound metal-dependent hydrolase [Halococcus hamelinensis 100A6]